MATKKQDKQREKLLNELRRLSAVFMKENPKSSSSIKKSWFLHRAGITFDQVKEFWPDFAAMKQEALGSSNKTEMMGQKRESLDPEDVEMRAAILSDIQHCAREFARENPNSTSPVKKNWYLQNTSYTEADIKRFWDTFGDLRKEALAEGGTTRDNFNRSIDFTGTPQKRYLVTTLIAGMPLNNLAMSAGIKDWCDRTGGELVFLLQRGPISSYQGYPREAGEQADRFVTECIFNNNLQAFDLMLNPQQISPLNAVGRIAQYKTSVIIASPKQDLKSHPVSQGTKLPHLAYTTGSISVPEYRPNRAGRLATLDHVNGALIVEVRSEEEFHVRQVQFDEWGGFWDVEGGYYGDPVTKKVRKDKRAQALNLGDIHFGLHNEAAVAGWKRLIKRVRPRHVFFHDLINHESINHHQDQDIIARACRPEWAKDLDSEITMVSAHLEQWCREFPDVQFVVVKSNHDEWLEQYIRKSKFAFSDVNVIMCAHMVIWMKEGKDPLAEAIYQKIGRLDNLRFLRRDDDFIIDGHQCGAHGDLTANGNRRGGIRALERAYGDGVFGHAHTAEISRRIWVNGTTSELTQEWMKGPSSQTHTSTVMWYGGGRQMVTLVNGRGHLTDEI